ncbi:MAG: substrate-binding domain-containing protein [Chloroflexi bacterium]|nr:substrate-binding domain-containing protein [Chloroflexota bacterium]
MKPSLIEPYKSKNWRRIAGWALTVVLLIVVAYYGWQAILSNSHAPVQLVVYAFSTQEEVFTQGIFPAFEAQWEADTGRDLSIEGVFGPSGTLAGQINLGAPADVAVFSNAQHVTWLKFGRVVREDTELLVIGCTPMVIVTRPGNPAGLAEFADLAQPGLRLLHADPRSSGAGEWAVLAEYGSALLESGGQSRAEAQLMDIWYNVRLLAPSGRAALTLFELGAGDALVTYEQDARLALERGVELEIVVPASTILAQLVAVIVDDNVTRAERLTVEAFIEFLASDDGQGILSRYHLRPADLDCQASPELIGAFTVEDLGGWAQAYTGLVENLWKTEIEPQLDLESALLVPGLGENK